MRKVKVLVVEDERAKREHICAEIRAFFGAEVCIDQAETLMEAARGIIGTAFDLIVTDLLLPPRRGEPEVDVSDDLIDHLANSERNRLTTVVAISRFDDVVARRQNAFARAGIFLVRYAEDWRTCLGICMQKVAFTTLHDFVVVCALEKERSAFEAVSQPGFVYGELVSAHGLDARELRIGDLSGVCVLQPRMGLVDAGIIATRALEAFSPRLICMAGICGGLKDEAPLGTLLISETTWEHQAGKWNAEGFDVRPYHEPIAEDVRVTLNQMILNDRDLDSLRSTPHEIAVPKVGADIRPVTSGSAVIASEGFAARIKKQHGKVAGIDMEVYGVHRAAALHGQAICFSAKTVVDHADEAKGDGLHQGGAILSARFVVKAIERLLAHPAPACGNARLGRTRSARG